MNASVPKVEQRYLDTRAAFDGVAGQYAGPLGNNRLVQEMREVLWRTVEKVAPPEARLLDLGCGVGLDAVHFAKQGFHITAIDWSPEMVAETVRRAEVAKVSGKLTVLNLGIQELDRLGGEIFDCIYSDLGALNCVAGLDAVAGRCASLLKPGGMLVFSVIGRFCPWELAYYSLQGKLGRARVRFARDQAPVNLNGGTVWARYYSPREFHQMFAAQFDWRECRALNLFLPPPYMIGPFERYPVLFKPLIWLDENLGRLPIFNRAGDHFLMVMSRRR